MSKIKLETEILAMAQVMTTALLTLDTNLFESGFDSLSIMGLVVQIEDHYVIELPLEGLTKERLRSVRSLVSTVCDLIP